MRWLRPFTLTGKRGEAGREARFVLLTPEGVAAGLYWPAAHALLVDRGVNDVEAEALLEAALHVGPVTEQFFDLRRLR